MVVVGVARVLVRVVGRLAVSVSVRVVLWW